MLGESRVVPGGIGVFAYADKHTSPRPNLHLAARDHVDARVVFEPEEIVSAYHGDEHNSLEVYQYSTSDYLLRPKRYLRQSDEYATVVDARPRPGNNLPFIPFH